jgi:hypothetical protein
MGATTARWYSRTSGVAGVVPGRWLLSVSVGDTSRGGLLPAVMARPGGEPLSCGC